MGAEAAHRAPVAVSARGETEQGHQQPAESGETLIKEIATPVLLIIFSIETLICRPFLLENCIANPN